MSKLNSSSKEPEQRSQSKQLQSSGKSKAQSKSGHDGEFSEENRSVAFIGVQNPSEKMTQDQARLLEVLKKRYKQSQSTDSNLGGSTLSRSDS